MQGWVLVSSLLFSEIPGLWITSCCESWRCSCTQCFILYLTFFWVHLHTWLAICNKLLGFWSFVGFQVSNTWWFVFQITGYSSLGQSLPKSLRFLYYCAALLRWLSAPLPPKHTHISIFFVFLARVFGRLISSFKCPSESQCTLWFCLTLRTERVRHYIYFLPLLSGDRGEQTWRHRHSVTIPMHTTVFWVFSYGVQPNLSWQ